MMKWALRSLTFLVVLAVGSAALASEADVDPKAVELIKKVTTTIGGMQMFQFGAYDTIDKVLPSGQMIQLSHTRSYVIKRPNKARMSSMGDVLNVDAYFDGTTFTWYDRGNNVYAQVEIPGTIDNLLDTIHEDYNIDTPMADLLYSDLWGPFLKNTLEGTYLGQHLAMEYECHHLAFRQESIDWQLWLQTGDIPHIRKFVITYKRLAGAPQYTAYITSGQTLEEIPDEVFQFTPPEGAEKVDFVVEKHEE